MSDTQAADVEDGLAWIATVYSLPEAALLDSTLRADGIQVFTQDAATISLNPNWMTALGGIKLFVSVRDLDRAVVLMEDADAGWTRPPRSYSPIWILNTALALALFLLCVCTPPPRVSGSYRWALSASRGPILAD